MRIPVDTIFVAVAVAVCLVDVTTHAERSGITTKLPCSLSAGAGRREGAIERHLRGQETVQDDEERVGPDPPAAESAVNDLRSTFGPEHIDEWLSVNKSAADVFRLLALDKVENVLSHPNLAILDNFVNKFNRVNPKDARTSVIAILTTHYGEEGFFKIIEAAKQVPETASLATRWQEKQFNFWVRQTKEPKDVFAIMELDKAEDELFEKPMMIMCVKYVNMFNEEHPDNAKTVLSLLQKYDEKRLVHMLIAAKKIPSTKKITGRVQAELTSSWLKQQKTPVEIFSLLDLDKAGDALFDNPLFAAWMKYVDDYNLSPKNGQRAKVVPILMSIYGLDVLAKMRVDEDKSPSFGRLALDLQLALHKDWFNEKYTYLQARGLVMSMNPAEGSTLLRALEDYDQYFKLHDIDYDNTLDALEKRFIKKEDLAKWVLKQYANPETEDAAGKLWTAICFRWIDKFIEPEEVHEWLQVNTAADQDIKLLSSTYSELYIEEYGTKRLKTTHSER